MKKVIQCIILPLICVIIAAALAFYQLRHLLCD